MSKEVAEKIETTCGEIIKASTIGRYNFSKIKAIKMLPHYCKKNKVKEEIIKKIMNL